MVGRTLVSSLQAPGRRAWRACRDLCACTHGCVARMDARVRWEGARPCLQAAASPVPELRMWTSRARAAARWPTWRIAPGCSGAAPCTCSLCSSWRPRHASWSHLTARPPRRCRRRPPSRPPTRVRAPRRAAPRLAPRAAGSAASAASGAAESLRLLGAAAGPGRGCKSCLASLCGCKVQPGTMPKCRLQAGTRSYN